MTDDQLDEIIIQLRGCIIPALLARDRAILRELLSIGKQTAEK